MKHTQLTSQQLIRTAAKAILILLLIISGASAQTAMELDQQKAARLKAMAGNYVPSPGVSGPGIPESFQVTENGYVSYSERKGRPKKHTILKETAVAGVYTFDAVTESRASLITVKSDGTFEVRLSFGAGKIDANARPTTTGKKQ